jgi:uncharacterized protein (UPF0548 family)
MFLRRHPSPAALERFLLESAGLPLSYDPVGIARQRSPSGFTVDQATVVVGRGDADFARARDALHAWAHFELGWVEVFPRRAPVVPGTVVAVLVRHLGFWSLNGCRVVYAFDGRTEAGFAYGTLGNHAEAGEEIFEVSLSPETREVTYGIRAVSRPHAVLARLGYPVARVVQARFRRDSGRAMRRAVGAG